MSCLVSLGLQDLDESVNYTGCQSHCDRGLFPPQPPLTEHILVLSSAALVMSRPSSSALMMMMRPDVRLWLTHHVSPPSRHHWCQRDTGSHCENGRSQLISLVGMKTKHDKFSAPCLLSSLQHRPAPTHQNNTTAAPSENDWWSDEL